MKECTETDKPLVSIVMATYNPRMDWLKEQLVSLNNQSYKALELLILDDCSSVVPLVAIENCVRDCITRIPFEINQNVQNLGSTMTFEKLTTLARGKYIAYCDQDDVWHRDKIEKCVEKIEASMGMLVFSDVNIIDGGGRRIADSMTKVRKHHRFQSGAGLEKVLLFSNFVTGCSMLINTDTAKEAVPFCPYMIHDHWLALFSSINGNLIFLEQPLIDYRIHENNQTLMMAGVTNKESYLKIRIEDALKKYLWYRERFRDNPELQKTITQAVEWMEARQAHFKNITKGIAIIWKYRKFSYWTSVFELIAPMLPENLFMFVIGLKKKNII